MRKLFFRDKPQFQDTMEVIAHGIVYEIHGEGLESLKDYAVIYFDPIDMDVSREWRSVKEVDTVEAMPGTYEEYEWDTLKLKLGNFERQQ